MHFGEVISLDPKRDAAWKRLGFKKHGNHWATDAQIAEDQEQKKADKFWGPHLTKVHKDIHGANGKPKKILPRPSSTRSPIPGPSCRFTASLPAVASRTN